jgi:hypothetical protein
MGGTAHLSTWIEEDAKQRFSVAAARQGLSASAFLRRLILQVLAASDSGEVATPMPAHARDARVTIRLVAEDHALLCERAAARTMPSATYISALVRAHLRQVAPLPDRELDALRSAVRELAALGRNVNVMARLMHQGNQRRYPGATRYTPCSRSAKGFGTISADCSKRIWPAGSSAVPRRVANLSGNERPLFNVASYARRGPEERIHISAAEIAQISRTVNRAPEVMVKVTRGATSGHGVIAHLQYIDRHGHLEIETDEGERLVGEGVEQALVLAWDLRSQEARARAPYAGRSGRKPARLVHNVVLSMPKGTAPEKLLAASRAFAREQFGLKHRYGLVLHTDQDHPHVHLVIKAVGEDGKRLNIRKATLRHWRQDFAAQLRARGVEANATERAVRGRSASPLKDSIYRAALRGESSYLRWRVERVFDQLRGGGIKATPGKAKLLETHQNVRAGWLNAADVLTAAGHKRLADQVRRFVSQMRPALTTDEQHAMALVKRASVSSS